MPKNAYTTKKLNFKIKSNDGKRIKPKWMVGSLDLFHSNRFSTIRKHSLLVSTKSFSINNYINITQKKWQFNLYLILGPRYKYRVVFYRKITTISFDSLLHSRIFFPHLGIIYTIYYT